MANTTRWALPYPVGTDVPDVPLWMNQLAVALDNVAMDDQGTLAARPVSTVGTPGKRGRYYLVTGDSTAANNGRLWRDNGTGWDEVVTNVPTVTALPGTPYDGQEIRLLVDATNGIVWHLKYRSGSASPYKWEFIGGSPLYNVLDTDNALGTVTTYGDLANVGPSLTMPFVGDYDFTYNANFYSTGNNVSGGMNLSGGGLAAPADDGFALYASVLGTTQQTGEKTRRRTITATGVVKAVYHSNGIAGGQVRWRSLKAVPVRIG